MKKVLLCVGGLALFCAFTATAFAGAIDNRTNWSAEWVRTLNRNAATDFADIAAYNPAGTVKLHEGFSLNGSLQYGKKDYTNNVSLPAAIPYTGCTDCESDEPSYIPGIFGVYNKGKWSLFGAFSNVAGGGKVDFEQGNWTTIGAQLFLIGADPTDNLVAPGPQQQISGESFYLGFTLGGAFALNDMLSFSVGLRYVDASREASASATILDGTLSPALTLAINYEEEGDGLGAIFGVNIAPNDKLNIGMRYETETDIDLKATVKQDFPPGVLFGLTGISDGQKRARDLPALLGLGASYWITPKLRTEINWTYYFNENADWAGVEDDVDNGYDAGIAFEYLLNDKLKVSIGYMYTDYGVEPGDMLPENPELDVNTIGGGIAYAINEKLHTNISIANSFYIDDSYIESLPTFDVPVEFEKNIFFVSFGIEYRFL
jgi:long-chain fatty acid transport protein